MGILDDIGEAFSDGADAVVGAVEDVIGYGEDAAEEAAKWFLERLLGEAFEDYINDGGSEVDTPDTEQYESTGSTRSSLDAIDDPLIHDYGTDNDTFTLPGRYTSRWSEMDSDDRDSDAVRLVTDGAIDTVDELTTEADGTPRHTSDRSEDRNTDATTQILTDARSDDAVSFTDDHGASGHDSTATTGSTTSPTSTALTDSLQFVATTDDDAGTTGDTATGRGRQPTHTPEWTNLNDSDPSVTLVDGSWMDDVTFTLDNHRGSSQRDGASLVEVDTTRTYSSYATSYDDASTTVSMSCLF
jgi:hypothetical protein